MTTTEERSLMVPLREHLSRPLATIQPVLARKGKPTVDLDRLEKEVRGIARVLPVIEIQSPEHWTQVIQSLGDEVDAIFPVSVPAYPTEIWNSHPEPLVRRGIPVVFWPLQEYDEPDFWRWSARDMLTSLGVKVVLVANLQEGKALMRAYGMRRFLSRARMVVFGDQNFPWNALSASTEARHAHRRAPPLRVQGPLSDVFGCRGEGGVGEAQGPLRDQEREARRARPGAARFPLHPVDPRRAWRFRLRRELLR